MAKGHFSSHLMPSPDSPCDVSCDITVDYVRRYITNTTTFARTPLSVPSQRPAPDQAHLVLAHSNIMGKCRGEANQTGEFLHKLRDSEGQELGQRKKTKTNGMGVGGIDIAMIFEQGRGVNGKL